ncbi:hypothetical protein A2U01_0116532, partial [Trifolium medium]|nr:hypothetical protein [Trifolium medium]
EKAGGRTNWPAGTPGVSLCRLKDKELEGSSISMIFGCFRKVVSSGSSTRTLFVRSSSKDGAGEG